MCRKVFVGMLVMAVLLSGKAIAAQYAFRITFTDKNNTSYSLSTPSAYLSSRALTRRTTQGIAIDSTDLPVNAWYVDSVVALTGGKLHGTSRWFNMCTILLADSSQILHLAGKSFISNIQLVGHYTANLHRTSVGSREAGKTTSTGAAYYGNTWGQTSLVHGNYLHNLGYKGQGKLIAVLDAGFIGANTHLGFDSMWSSGRMVDTFNFTNRNTNVFTQDGHGTEVLSTMAGYVPDTFVGCAPLAMYALYITEIAEAEQPLEFDNLLYGAERADSIGADVITESLGYDLLDYPSGAGLNFATDLDGKSTLCSRAANMATTKGMLFIASAGNDGQGYFTWGNHISTPGDADSALTIGSTDASGNIWPTSGVGPNAAGRIKPDVCAQGHAANIFSVFGGYTAADGTSISTPQVAGLATCLWQANPAATPYMLRMAITHCASAYDHPTPQFGYGLANFECAQAAMLAVLDTPPPFTTANWVIPAPNPFINNLELAISLNADQNVTFILLDMAGKQMLHTSASLHSGYNKSTLPLSFLPCGIYILKAVAPDKQQVLRVQKL